MSTASPNGYNPPRLRIFGDPTNAIARAAMKSQAQGWAARAIPQPKRFFVGDVECEISVAFGDEIDSLPAGHGYSEHRDGVHIRIREAGLRIAD